MMAAPDPFAEPFAVGDSAIKIGGEYGGPGIVRAIVVDERGEGGNREFNHIHGRANLVKVATE